MMGRDKKACFLNFNFSNNRKAQSGMEFLAIFAIGFSLIVIFTGIFFTYFTGEKEAIDKKHIEKIGHEIISNVEKIYFLGEENRVTIDTKFPKGIVDLRIHHVYNYTLPVTGENVSYDYLNISYVSDGDVYSMLFEPREMYIRFNCTICYHNTTHNFSYYNESLHGEGFRRIRFESMGDWVAVDFMQLIK